jgi:NAD(P)-dependent dehydrogenase (short-subunit alcohol dehydrogenase family)
LARHTRRLIGPYSMSKHALEAMGKSIRAEMTPQVIDVCLLNPGPYNTGLNDRMADTMWEWFDDKAINAPNRDTQLRAGEHRRDAHTTSRGCSSLALRQNEAIPQVVGDKVATVFGRTNRRRRERCHHSGA